MSALIVTALIHEDDLRPFHRLRRRFFPRNRHFVSAHVTLFHHLPGEREKEVLTQVHQSVAAFADGYDGFRQNVPTTDNDSALAVTRDPSPDARFVPVGLRRVFNMGRGVAYALDPEPLVQLRQPIAAYFGDALTPQDARPWRNPHITVQNKVDPAAARRLYRHLDARFEECSLRVGGLQVFEYKQGPWRFVDEARF